MGYRSEVKLVTTKEGWEKIDQAVRKVAGVIPKNEDDMTWLTERTCWTPVCNGKYVLAEWDDIKWYDGYDSQVSTVMSTLDKLEKILIPYRFMRVGEDYSDVEIREHDGDGWQTIRDMPSLWLKREIEVEY